MIVGAATIAAGALIAGVAPGAVVAAAAQAVGPDSWTLAYTAGRGDAELWRRDGRNAEPVNLTRSDAQDHWARWSPDGSRIVFQSLRDGQREVYAMDSDGASPTNLTRHPAQDLLPAVSPDGNSIAFFSDRGIDHGPRQLPGNIYLMAVTGGDAERLTATPLTSTFGPDFSPDGRTLLFARAFDGDVDLVVMDLESRDERRLPGTAAAEYGGSFSPDGDRIAFHAAGEGGEARIVVMNVDGSGRRDVTRGGQHYDPRWSPDGEWLLFSGAPLGATDFDLLVVATAGGDPWVLVGTEADERAGAWKPVR